MDAFSESLLFCVWAGLVKPILGKLGSQFEVRCQGDIRMWLMKSIKHKSCIVKADFGCVNSNSWVLEYLTTIWHGIQPPIKSDFQVIFKQLNPVQLFAEVWWGRSWKIAFKIGPF